MSNAIVVKSALKKTQTYLGFVRPIIREQENESPQPSGVGDFPSVNAIFITTAYEIVNDFEDDELFRIPYWKNDRLNETDDPNYCAYIADGSNATSLGTDEYFHVIDATFDIENRYVSLRYKPKRRLMIRDGTKSALFGPFDYEVEPQPDGSSYRFRLKACPPLPRFPPLKDCVYKFSAQDFEVLEHAGQTILLANMRDLASATHEAVDYIGDEQLIKLGNDLLPAEQRLTKRDLTAYRDAIIQLSQTEQSFDEVRRKRLTTLLGRTDLWVSQRSNLITEYLKTAEGTSQIHDYLSSNLDEIMAAVRDRYSKELDEQRGSIEARRDKLKLESEAVSQDLEVLRAEKQRLAKENEQTREQVNTRQQEELSEQTQRVARDLEEKKRELSDVESALSETAGSLKLARDIKTLKDEQAYWKRDVDEKKNEIRQLEDTRNKILQEVKVGQDDLKNELRKLKPYVDVLNGIIPDQDSSQVRSLRTPGRRDKHPSSASELIEEIRSSLAAGGREYRFEQVANFLLSIHQNFLTVFAGLPGVGKTSLATYLAGTLGLSNNDRFLSIPIARGMTSQRDILGFYNPLTQRYQPAPTGLWEAVKACEREAADPDLNKFPYWILLDEANLSPIEHYFSAFVAMCDGYVDKRLRTGEPNDEGTVQLPAGMRFIATVNYDNTTEPLSPRMIDRVPVILIPPPETGEIVAEAGCSVPEALLSYDDLCKLFAPDGDTFTGDEYKTFSGVLDALRSVVEPGRGLPVIISPRKRDAVQRWCCVARNLMRGRDGKGPALCALDYAVAQHLLPALNGNGDKYRSRLTDLQKAVDQLDYSKSILRRIVEVGDDEYKFYRFFC